MSNNLIERANDFLRQNMRATIQLGGVSVVDLVRELAEEIESLRSIQGLSVTILLREAEQLQAIRAALGEYNAALARREHGAVAAARLIAVVIDQTHRTEVSGE